MDITLDSNHLEAYKGRYMNSIVTKFIILLGLSGLCFSTIEAYRK